MRIYPGHIVIYKKTGQRVIVRKVKKYTYLIEFVNKLDFIDIIEVSMGEIEQIDHNYEKCPKCGDRYTYTKSPILDKLWEDCIRCGKTKKDLEKR